MAPYLYDVSQEGDSDSVESEEKSFCAPSRNQTGDLSQHAVGTQMTAKGTVGARTGFLWLKCI
jgi:hypothetical protein